MGKKQQSIQLLQWADNKLKLIHQPKTVKGGQIIDDEIVVI